MRYEAIWYDHYGNRKGVIQAFNSLEYIKTQNQVGSLVINLPRGLMQYDQFAVGDIFEVWREKNGTLELQNETAYFLQNWEFWTDDEGHEFIRLTASDANWLLDGAIIWQWTGIAGAETTMTNHPDDMMKAIVSQEVGIGHIYPQKGKVSVAPDLSAGGTAITKEFAWRNVLSTIQEIAEAAEEGGVWVGFDVVRTAPGAFEFRTYTGQRGQNHGRSSGDPRLVGKQYGNLSEASFGEFHAEERNVIVIAAGRYVTRSNTSRMYASKWNRREYLQSAGNDVTDASLEAEGDAALDKFKPKQIMTGTLHDTPGMQFNIHYGFGDVLSVEAFGYHVDCHVKAVRVLVDQDNGEQLDIKLEGEL